MVNHHEKCDTIESEKREKNEYKEQLNVLSEKNNSENIEEQKQLDEQIKKLE